MRLKLSQLFNMQGMKNGALCGVALLFLFIGQDAAGQDDEQVAINEPFYYYKSSGKLLPLEKKETTLKNRTKLLGYGGSTSTYTIEGEHSPVVIPADSVIFRIEIEDMGFSMADPSQMSAIYRCAVEQGKRIVVLQKTKGVFSGGGTPDDSKRIAFSIKKKDGFTWWIIDRKLNPGEYAIVNPANFSGDEDNSITVFCFRVE